MNAMYSMEDFRKAYARGDMHEAERIYGCLLVSDARDGGHRPTNFERHELKGGARKRRVVRNASPETLRMMRLLSEKDYSTVELAEICGITPDAASWRLSSLWRGRFLDKTGETGAEGRRRSSMIYTRGPRMDAWLAAYEGVE